VTKWLLERSGAARQSMHYTRGDSGWSGQAMPSFSAAIRVPSTRLVIFWKAMSRA
jgi:hypothetical protein